VFEFIFALLLAVSVNTRVWLLHTGRGKAAILNFSKIYKIIFESKTVISYRVAILLFCRVLCAEANSFSI